MSLLGKIINDPLYQTRDPRRPEDLVETDLIISPDTRRERRLPPGQSRTKKWPVLDANGTPDIDLETWNFRLGGLVEHPLSFSRAEFMELPQVRVYADFHCVTRWSRLDNIWTGVSARELAQRAGLDPAVRFVKASAYDSGWTTNLPLQHFLAEDSLFAFLHDGEPIAPDHGGPVRLIVPQLYAWKSAKWVNGVRFLAEDEPGFWEAGGYHMRGVPWNGDDGERYRRNF
jgi:DMSO/TMAO reductase YedYZ molybdopterin-dependent catalytic subunit